MADRNLIFRNGKPVAVPITGLVWKYGVGGGVPFGSSFTIDGLGLRFGKTGKTELEFFAIEALSIGSIISGIIPGITNEIWQVTGAIIEETTYYEVPVISIGGDIFESSGATFLTYFVFSYKGDKGIKGDTGDPGADFSIEGAAAGDLAYYNGSAWARVPIGTPGQLLMVALGAPSWVNPPEAGACINYRYSQNSTMDSTALVIPFDNTTPQITEGKELLTLDYTPKNGSNLLEVEFTAWASGSALLSITFALFEIGNSDALAATALVSAAANYPLPVSLRFNYGLLGTTTPRTFAVRYGPSSGTAYVNRRLAELTYGGTSKSLLTAKEFKTT
jgi:hypothetical protein